MSAPHAPGWSRLSSLVAESLGLHFPAERSEDLKRAVAAAAHEFGYDDVDACVRWLLSKPPSQSQIQVLASHLTVGETYFYRDASLMGALAATILPQLVREKAGGERRLRFWSAGCCSGEEAYTLAILLHRLLPDLDRWNVTITATDVNPRFLHKAANGTYGEWSFRSSPAWLRSRYFARDAAGRYVIDPEIARMVTFSYLNLAEDAYPSLATGTNAMDLVLCRNVLMYFAPPKMRQVIANLGRSLVEGGWLAVSASESAKELFPDLVRVDLPGAMVFRKQGGGVVRTPAVPRVPPEETGPLAFPATREAASLPAEPPPATPRSPPAQAGFTAADALYREGRYAEAVEALQQGLDGSGAAGYSLLVHALANMGRLADALAWCDRWIAASKLDAAAHYLRAVVLLERREPSLARTSLQRAIYLEPRFVVAHYALGNIAREQGDADDASRHFGNALRLLRALRPDEALPGADGLTAGRLADIIASFAEIDGDDES